MKTATTTSTRAIIVAPASAMAPAKKAVRSGCCFASRAMSSVTAVDDTRLPATAESSRPRRSPATLTAT